MGTSLVNRINGQTFSWLNTLHNRQTITIYVENDDDVPFWNFFFSKRKLPTKITPATTGDKRGKKSVLDFADRLSKEFLLCVDSDFDYLFNCNTEQSRQIINNPFIFHTYIHSIESFKCYLDILENVFVDATRTKNGINFNIDSFINTYSEKIYDLFIKFLYYEQKYQVEYEQFSALKKQKENELSGRNLETWINSNKPIHVFPLENGLNNTILISPLLLNDTQANNELLKLEQKIQTKNITIPEPDSGILDQLKVELAGFGLEKLNTYLFIQGHLLFENVVLRFLSPLFNKVISNKRTIFYAEINAETDVKMKENIENNLRHFESLIMPIQIALESHKYYDVCPFSIRIMNDIDNYISNCLNKN